MIVPPLIRAALALIRGASAACASGGAALNVRVSGAGSAGDDVAAEVYVDGEHVGGAPVSNVSVSPGQHRLRIDCEFEGESHRGGERVVDIPAGADAVIEHTCDVWVTLGR